MTLKDLEIGKSAVIKAVGGEGALRQHFLDMGVIPGYGTGNAVELYMEDKTGGDMQPFYESVQKFIMTL